MNNTPKNRPVVTYTPEARYLPGDKEYIRAAKAGAWQAVKLWLKRLEASPELDPYRPFEFKANGVQCFIQFHPGHWGGVIPYGIPGGGRWIWAREGIDPDEDLSGEDVLLDVALGRPIGPKPLHCNRRGGLPPYARSELTLAQVERRARARARRNLAGLGLHLMSKEFYGD